MRPRRSVSKQCLGDKDSGDVDTIVDESVVRRLIPRLESAGACGIVEYPLNKIID